MAIKKFAADKTDGGITMNDIARLAGVSPITVSRALRNSPLVTQATCEKIHRIAAETGYRFNPHARNLRMRRSYSVAVVVEMTTRTGRPMSDPYPLELLGAITQELTTSGYSAVLTSTQLMNNSQVQGSEGLILLGQGLQGSAVRMIETTGLPTVVWGARDADSAHVIVGSDNWRGGASAAEHFTAIGRKKFIFLGDVGHAEVRERCAGFIGAVGSSGTVHIIRPQAFTFEAGFDSLAAVLKTKGHIYDGIFAASDTLAMGAIAALAAHNLRVPEQVSVIGYDDTPAAASFIPALTSVHQNLYEGGILLAKKVLALINGEQVESEVLPTQLVVRKT